MHDFCLRNGAGRAKNWKGGQFSQILQRAEDFHTCMIFTFSVKIAFKLFESKRLRCFSFSIFPFIY